MTLNIQGLQKLTLLDYPGKVACTLFFGGCNFRCPFCHNGSLVREGGRPQAPIPVAEVLAFLKARQGLLEGVCLTGGEPLLQDIAPLVRQIKALGYDVKLDTNGSRPQALAALLAEGLLDQVAMDVKNRPEDYARTVGLDEVDLGAIQASVDLLLSSDVDVEFRTTVCQELHPPEAVKAIAHWLKEAPSYVLQNYRDEGDLLQGGFHPYDEAFLCDLARKLGPGVCVRGQQ